MPFVVRISKPKSLALAKTDDVAGGRRRTARRKATACALAGKRACLGAAGVAAQRSSGLFFGYFLWASKESDT